MVAESNMTPVLPQVSMPSVFVSHGSPMLALEAGPYQDALAQFGRSVRPCAIIAISAHWGSGKTISVTRTKRNTTIHDFAGFPAPLYELTYNAPGDPELASHIVRLLQENGFHAAATTTTTDRGLDHGTWIPLRLMYPEADIPVVAISAPLQLSPEQLYKIGQALAPLRERGVMILGSGGIVHNLRLVHFADPQAQVERWAAEFDRWFGNAVGQNKLADLFSYEHAGPHAQLAVPTFEHFAPVFVVLGAASEPKEVITIYDGFEHGNISMRSFALLEEVSPP
jgi:4,5-DOPA dioxygenase extradiol